MEATKAKCGLCEGTFNTDRERLEHESQVHSAEVRQKREKEQVPAWDGEETAA